jgi:signal transduction histidine kinase
MIQQHKRPWFSDHPAVFFICCCLCFCVCFFSPAVFSASVNPSYERSYFIDKQLQFDIDTIDSAPFTPYTKHFNLGYQKTPVWVQIRITPSNASSELTSPSELSSLLLRVGPHDTNRIDMYEFDQGLWQVQTAGDLQPGKENSCVDDYYCFRLRNHTLEPRTVYVKIQTYSFLMPDTEVVTLENLSLASSARIKRIYIALTVTFFMLVIGLYWLIRHRSRLTIVYCIFQTCVLVYLLSIYGFPAVWFPNLSVEILDALPHLLFMMRTLLLNLVIFVVVGAYCSSVLYHRSVFFLVAVCALNIYLFFSSYRIISIQLNLLIFSIQPSIHLYGVFKSKGMVKNVSNLLKFSYFIYNLILISSLLPWLLFEKNGSVDGPFQNISDWRLNGIFVGIFVFLLIRFEENYREKIQAEQINQNRIDKIEAASYAAMLSDRNTLIDLLTHDLKNSLGTITFASRALKENSQDHPLAAQKIKHIDISVNRMNRLIEHVAVSARLDRYVPSPADPGGAASDLIDELIETYTDQERFDIDVDTQASFKVDREMLIVILGNLIQNAYKYGHEGGTIKISVKPYPRSEQSATAGTTSATEQQILYFEISNAIGTYGLPDAEHLFERYYRHPNSMALPGLGLGLSLVKAAAAKIGASIDFQHNHETVTFTVAVPN